MAITQTLNAKYPDWTQEDWDRFRWINSWNRRRRNLAPLLPCKRCGTAAIFEEDHEDMPYHNMFTLRCPKCHRYLETTTDLNPQAAPDGGPLEPAQWITPVSFPSSGQRNRRERLRHEPQLAAGTEPTEGEQMRARELARMKARKKEKK